MGKDILEDVRKQEGEMEGLFFKEVLYASSI